ncbi:MAG: hypothetical protein WA476_12780 [Acidobacteriaceae bacterium]
MARSPNRTPHPSHSLPLICAAPLLLLLPLPAFVQSDPSPATDAAALIRRSVANHMTAEAAHHPQRFVLHKKDDRRDYIQEIIETRQGDVALAIAANGAPLNPDLRQSQIDRLSNLDAHPDLQEHRHKRELEDNARVDKLMRLLPDAFLYHDDGIVPCTVNVPPEVLVPGSPPASQPTPPPTGTATPSAECYHLTFKPNPAWSPPDIESKIMRGMAGEVWIEKSQERLTRLNAQLIADVDFGWGFIGHLDKGGTIYLEQTETTPNDWELTRMKLNLTGRALLVKALNIRMTEEMAHYSPVPTDLDYHKAIQMLQKAQPPPAK